ncbi:MAG: KamA family radical SAM protein [Armatimonadetes bacterium]|jgi:lysine 2,3-aminomutase|nr:KamA family radical SAM protein [Armatimonadota bacterium]MDI9601951.1 KamA family radical SAM protein [Acidobacteriota bacterium]
MNLRIYTADDTRTAMGPWAERLATCSLLDDARRNLYRAVTDAQYTALNLEEPGPSAHVIRDCARALRSMLAARSDRLAGISATQALLDVAAGRPRGDLGPGFHAEMTHIWMGLRGEVRPAQFVPGPDPDSEGGDKMTSELGHLWEAAANYTARYEDGLSPEAVARRQERKAEILQATGGTEADWQSWEWQARHAFGRVREVEAAVALTDSERQGLEAAEESRLPFSVTPYYASLMDKVPGHRDRSIRAQVFPSVPVAHAWGVTLEQAGRESMDYMGEGLTSPVPLVTRRYPSIAVLKPFNACPQLCVYCQRNWEICGVMSPEALAPWEQIENALWWIESNPAITELLITGGDPLGMSDALLERLLKRVAAIKHIDVVRIGTRTPVTVPMRITERLADIISRVREPGTREVMVVTHIQHPYEVTPELVQAVDRLRSRGIGVYNQLVYTFYVSRRFEATSLRMLLRRAGVDPYYTFVAKAKPELRGYRVPLARLLQEQKEEVRLLPGTRRTDEAVYNIPRLGKSHIRAAQHRDLIGVGPDGARIYEFHPWEKNITPREPHVGADVPIYEYLQRLAAIGENLRDYHTIWYYF